MEETGEWCYPKWLCLGKNIGGDISSSSEDCIRERMSVCVCVCFHTELCPILCNPVDCSPRDYLSTGLSVHGIILVRKLKCVAISSSRGSSWPRDAAHSSCSSCIGRQILTTEPLKKPHEREYMVENTVKAEEHHYQIMSKVVISTTVMSWLN